MDIDTTRRLAGYRRNGPNYLHHDDFENVVDVMRAIVDARHGVSAPLVYERDSFDSVSFYPDGRDGGMISLRNAEAR